MTPYEDAWNRYCRDEEIKLSLGEKLSIAKGLDAAMKEAGEFEKRELKKFAAWVWKDEKPDDKTTIFDLDSPEAYMKQLEKLKEAQWRRKQ